MARISAALCIGLAAAAVAGGCASDPLAPGRARQLALVSPAEQAKSIREYLGILRANMNRPGFTYSARRSDGRAVTIEEDIALQEQALALLEQGGGATAGVALSRSQEVVPGLIALDGSRVCNGPVCGYSTFLAYDGFLSGSGTTDANPRAITVSVQVKIEAACNQLTSYYSNTFVGNAAGYHVSAAGTLTCPFYFRGGGTTSKHGGFVLGNVYNITSQAGYGG